MGRGRKTTVFTGKRRKLILTTRVKHYKEDYVVPVSEDWIKWAFTMKWEYADKEREDNERNKSNLLTHLAAQGGFKDVLVWLKDKGCEPKESAPYPAAGGGHVDVLEYLKSVGVPFDEHTCRNAARG